MPVNGRGDLTWRLKLYYHLQHALQYHLSLPNCRPVIGYPRDTVILSPRKRKINNALLTPISLNCITIISDYSEVTGRAYEHKMQNCSVSASGTYSNDCAGIMRQGTVPTNPRRTIQMPIRQEIRAPVTEMDRNRSPAHKSENRQVEFYFLAYIRDIPHVTVGTCNTIRTPQ